MLDGIDICGRFKNFAYIKNKYYNFFLSQLGRNVMLLDCMYVYIFQYKIIFQILLQSFSSIAKTN